MSYRTEYIIDPPKVIETSYGDYLIDPPKVNYMPRYQTRYTNSPRWSAEKKTQWPIEKPTETPSSTAADPISEYPPPSIFAINMVAVYIGIFCVALDTTILSTAIPKITDEFHALEDVGWYGSAYTLTMAAFLLTYGKLYTLFSAKWTFVVSLLIFEVGSLVSGIAWTSMMLIIGRAVAGIGAAGVASGVMIIITHTSPIEKRPIWTGLVSAMYGIASVLGPLFGGFFADHLTWRWCFYVNLPLGGISGAIIVFFLRLAPQKRRFADRTAFEKFMMLDPVGFSLFIPGIVSLFLALEWGGSKYDWTDWQITMLFLVSETLIVAFILLQNWLGENATLPFRILSQQTIWSASWFAFFISGAFFVFIYFLPIYFQAVKGEDPLESGIHNIPLILSNVVLAILSGVGVSKIGYINPFCYGSVALASLGAALLMTMTAETGALKWVGYQVVFGAGIGLGYQQPPSAPPTVLPFQDLPMGIAITLFARNFGAALFITVGNNIFDNELRKSLEALPGIDLKAVLDAGATSFRSILPAADVPGVTHAYENALQKTFGLGLLISVISLFGVVFIEWRCINGKDALKPR